MNFTAMGIHDPRTFEKILPQATIQKEVREKRNKLISERPRNNMKLWLVFFMY